MPSGPSMGPKKSSNKSCMSVGSCCNLRSRAAALRFDVLLSGSATARGLSRDGSGCGSTS
eukprot:2914681-Pyramimonas_sp.AAC.1